MDTAAGQLEANSNCIFMRLCRVNLSAPPSYTTSVNHLNDQVCHLDWNKIC